MNELKRQLNAYPRKISNVNMDLVGKTQDPDIWYGISVRILSKILIL